MRKSFLDSNNCDEFIQSARNFKNDLNAGHATQSIFKSYELRLLKSGVSFSREDAARTILTGVYLTDLKQHKNTNIYYFSDDFAPVLQTVEINVKPSMLPKLEKPFLLEFPIITTPSSAKLAFNAVLISKEKGHLSFAFFTKESSVFFTFNLETSDIETTLDLILEQQDASKEELQKLQEAVKFALNALLYINSGDPDLRDHNPKAMPKDYKGGKNAWSRYNKQEFPYAATIVGFGYKKENLRHADESQVIGHFRWQPYGKERAQLKLIWIEPHIRTYQKDPVVNTSLEGHC
jgi:hypothetical protein